MQAAKSYKKAILIGAAFLGAAALGVGGYYKHQQHQEAQWEEYQVQQCEKAIAHSEEMTYVLNQITYYKRTIKAQESSLREHSDELYRIGEEINEDLYLKRNEPTTVCIAYRRSVDELLDSLEKCQKRIADLYPTILKGADACLADRIKRLANEASDQVDELEKWFK